MEEVSQCSSSVISEAVEFDLRGGGLFPSLLGFTLPSPSGGGSDSSSSSSEEVADWQCLRLTFGREGLLVRGASKGREVHAELLLPVSFFEGFEYRKQQQQEQQQQEQQQQEETESVLVPLKTFVNALLLFGDTAHMRLRYVFGEGVLLLLLQQQQKQQQQQVFSEIAIKTYSAGEGASSGCLSIGKALERSAGQQRDYLSVNPQLFREVLQELLLCDDDAAAKVVIEWHPLPAAAAETAAGAETAAAGTQNTANFAAAADGPVGGDTKQQQLPLMTLTVQSLVAHRVSFCPSLTALAGHKVTAYHRHEFYLSALQALGAPLKTAQGLRLEFSNEGFLLAQLRYKADETPLFLRYVLLPCAASEAVESPAAAD